MTDNEIIQALECCGRESCLGCPYRSKCHQGNPMIRDALDLINRQKSEIERLSQKENSLCVKIAFDRNELQEIAEKCVKNIEIDINLAKADAIKDFAERLKNKIKTECNPYGKPTFDYDTSISIMRYIDNLVKEMVGENND